MIKYVYYFICGYNFKIMVLIFSKPILAVRLWVFINAYGFLSLQVAYVNL